MDCLFEDAERPERGLEAGPGEYRASEPQQKNLGIRLWTGKDSQPYEQRSEGALGRREAHGWSVVHY